MAIGFSNNPVFKVKVNNVANTVSLTGVLVIAVPNC